MKNYLRTLTWLVLVVMLLAGCSTPSEEAASLATDAASTDALAPPPPAEPGQPELVTPGVATNRQLVYNAELDLRVEDLSRTVGRVDSLVRGAQGWTQTATQTRSDNDWQQEMTIRVRPEKLTGLLAALTQLGVVERKSLTSEDITAEHADVTARLRNKKALEQRYLALLQQARKVSDVLEVEEKLGAVREDIEAVESRLKVLNEQVAHSTITLSLHQHVVPNAPAISGGSRLLESLYGGWELSASLVFGFLYLWPVWLLLAAGWWGVRAWRRRK